MTPNQSSEEAKNHPHLRAHKKREGGETQRTKTNPQTQTRGAKTGARHHSPGAEEATDAKGEGERLSLRAPNISIGSHQYMSYLINDFHIFRCVTSLDVSPDI